MKPIDALITGLLLGVLITLTPSVIVTAAASWAADKRNTLVIFGGMIGMWLLVIWMATLSISEVVTLPMLSPLLP